MSDVMKRVLALGQRLEVLRAVRDKARGGGALEMNALWEEDAAVVVHEGVTAARNAVERLTQETERLLEDAREDMKQEVPQDKG